MNDVGRLRGDSLLSDATAVVPLELQGELCRIMDQINLELPDQANRVIVVTGVEAGDGVTTTALWLATFLATGYIGDILYLDADPGSSGKPKGRVEPGGPGLLELIEDPDRRDGTYRKTALPNLFTMRALPDGTSGVKRITDRQVAQAIECLRKRFAYVVVDAQPPSSSPLAISLARHSDGALVVIEANKTDRTNAVTTVSVLRRNGARILGAIVNKGSRR